MSWLPLQTVAQLSVERILNALPEGLLIAFFAWALLRVLRRQNSGTRFAVWFLALVSVAALPLLGSFGEGSAPISSSVSSGSLGHLRPALTMPAHWAVFVFVVWIAGAAAAMLRLAAGVCRLRQLRRSCTPVDASGLDPIVQRTWSAIAASGSSSVTIATSESVRVPSALGFWKRTIVLPAWALRELPPEDLNVILLHEFAHLRRGDDWTNLIQKMVRGLFFFHPAVWWIESELSVEREMACDDAVLAATGNPHGYATCLVSLLEKSVADRLSKQPWSMAQAAVHRAREAALRLARILDANRSVATRISKPALAMVSVFSMVCLMALPIAPQFVAFDRGQAPENSGAVYSASAHSSLEVRGTPAVEVIPAALRSVEASSSSAAVVAKVSRARAVSGHKVAASTLAAQSTVEPGFGQVLQASATEDFDKTAVPRFQTLVFIEATQYGPNATLWNVQVWQVTLIHAGRESNARVPAPKSI